MDTEVLLTLEQIAEFLAVSRDTVYRMAQQAKIPAVKVGNQWRFEKTEVSEWLKKNHNLKQSAKVKQVANAR